MKPMILLSAILATSAVASDRLDQEQCGLQTVGELRAQGWKVVKDGYVAKISDGRIELEDGTLYEADMTSGIFAGDGAIVLSLYVRSRDVSGHIFTLCAGGFDAWVTPLD